MPLRIAPVAKLVGGGLLVALVALGGVWVWHQWQTGRLQGRIGELELAVEAEQVRRAEWQASANALAATIEHMVDEHARAEAAVRHLQVRLAETEASYRKLQDRIRDAPAEADGAVAPVLREALEVLP